MSVLALAASLAILPMAPVSATAQAGECQYASRDADALSGRTARKAMRCLINLRRNDHGVGDLASDDRLRRAAGKHSRRMTEQNCFSHQCPGEGSLLTRLINAGYIVSSLRLWGYAETIGWGRRSKGEPRDIVRRWMRSSTHRDRILAARFEHLGVGFAEGSPVGRDRNAATFTVDLGFRDG